MSSATRPMACSSARLSCDNTVKSATTPHCEQIQVVMVVLGEILGQLVTGELVGAGDPMDDARLGEDREVAVHRGSRARCRPSSILGDGERVVGGLEDLYHRPAIRGVPLADRRSRVATVSAGGRRRPSVGAYPTK